MSQDVRTIIEYERLSYFEKEEITKWVKKNISNIPATASTRKDGLTQLLVGNYEDHAALVLVRYAMKVLRVVSKL